MSFSVLPSSDLTFTRSQFLMSEHNDPNLGGGLVGSEDEVIVSTFYICNIDTFDIVR